jgi:competence protein ComEA
MLMRVFPMMVLSCLAALATVVPGAALAQTKSSSRAAKPASTQIVNVNTATAADFEALPGIGPKMAARIIEYRQKNGPFKKVEELMNVRGLGEKNFLKLKAQLTLGAPKTTDREQQ